MAASNRHPLPDTIYRRSYRLYNRLFGTFYLHEYRHDNLPMESSDDISAVGAVILQGWVSA